MEIARVGLRSLFPQGSGGSSPLFRTTANKGLGVSRSIRHCASLIQPHVELAGTREAFSGEVCRTSDEIDARVSPMFCKVAAMGLPARHPPPSRAIRRVVGMPPGHHRHPHPRVMNPTPSDLPPIPWWRGVWFYWYRLFFGS